MLDKLKAIADRFVHLEEQLSDPSVIGDMDKFKKVNKDYKDLTPIVEAYKKYVSLLDRREQAQEMLADADMREMAREELNEVEPEINTLEEDINILLIPKDPEDSKDVLFEIRSGTGGDEASLFAGDLYRMYQRYFDRQGWKTDVMEINEGTVGGYNKLVLEVTGEDVYGKLKFESGAHRVQRIPETESKGRVHTSAATVAVIPKLEMEDVEIRREDLKIDVYRASGAGGQHVNRTESAVRITHLPTGVVSECQEGRSQIQNREIALQRLYNRIYEAKKEAHDAEQANKRRSLVGSGDRSDKIRTYNFPQNRVTDHRLEGDNKNFNLDKVIEGDIDGILEALRIADNAEKLKGDED
ncbi:MAG: peptide chain release factor 1 [Saprospiraceae bacterium]|nr:peptide chain release factor 1 [Saprospiraceae bacterium]